MTLLVGAHHY